MARPATHVVALLALLAGFGTGFRPGAERRSGDWTGVARDPSGAEAAVDDNGGLALHTVERTFDSRGLVLEERQDGRVVSRTFTGDAKRTSLTYPSGRVLGYTHDVVDRVKRLTDGTGPGAPLVAEYSWIGPGSRVLQRRHGNGTALTHLDDLGRADVGYDAVQRVVRLRHVGPSGQAFVDRVHAYDRASNRLSEQRLDDQGLTDSFTYDSTYRVVTSSFDQGGAPGAARRGLESAGYRYDGVGNRVEVRERRAGPSGGDPVALHADQRVDVDHDARVEGHVVADGRDRCQHGRRNCSCGQRPRRRSDVDVGPQARVVGNATGEVVTLRHHARVDGDVSTTLLQKHSTATVGGALLPYQAPGPIPDVEPITPGLQDVTINPHGQAQLLPGAYRDVEVKHHGRLILTGGTYLFRDLRLGPDVVLEVRAAVLVRAARRLELDHDAVVLLGAGVQPTDLRWESLDPNTSIGPSARFVGTLVAPNGDVNVAHHADLTGKVLAERIRVGPSAVARAAGASGGGTVETTVAYAANSLNQYVTVGGVARTHDRNGNLTDDGQRRLAWDYRNRLVAVSNRASGVGIATYTYDCGNRRVTKTVSTPQGARTTRSLWDGWDLIEEQAASGATEVTYVSGPGADEHLQVARTAAHPAGAAVLWCHQDARGSVVAVSNASGAVVERTRFDDFGRPDQVGSVPHGFQGRYRDQETGWVYFRNRVYEPETGRFLSRDPVWDPANVGNLYTFVGSNPATWLDPLGRWCLKGLAADLSGWNDVKTAFGGMAAEWQQGNYGWAALYAVGGAFIAVDAALTFVPGVGQGKALVKTGVKEGLELGVKAAFREGGQEGLERLGREGAETALERADNAFDSRFADDPRLGDTAPVQWSDAESQAIFADLVQTQEGRGALANLVTEDVNVVKFVPFLPNGKAGTTIVDKTTGSIDVLVATNGRSAGNIGKTLVHEADHVGDVAKRGTFGGEIQAEQAARRHVNEILTGTSTLSDAEKAAITREAAGLYPELLQKAMGYAE